MVKDKPLKATINVKGIDISITSTGSNDYISLTDMLKAKDGEFFIADWLRNRNTVEFLGIWEQIYNPTFNYGEFAIIKSQAGLNSYKISVKEWVEKTNAIGLVAKAGRYGGTYAHKDIAFEFGMWISPEFKLYLIKEYQNLKENENSRLSSEWNVKRVLAKANYRIHTDAIKENLISNELTSRQISITYASEADVLNVALFGKTAREWREENFDAKGNIRDFATIEQLIVMVNLENMNAHLINQGLEQQQRLIELNKMARSQLQSFFNHSAVKQIKNMISETTSPILNPSNSTSLKSEVGANKNTGDGEE